MRLDYIPVFAFRVPEMIRVAQDIADTSIIDMPKNRIDRALEHMTERMHDDLDYIESGVDHALQHMEIDLSLAVTKMYIGRVLGCDDKDDLDFLKNKIVLYFQTVDDFHEKILDYNQVKRDIQERALWEFYNYLEIPENEITDSHYDLTGPPVLPPKEKNWDMTLHHQHFFTEDGLDICLELNYENGDIVFTVDMTHDGDEVIPVHRIECPIPDKSNLEKIAVHVHSNYTDTEKMLDGDYDRADTEGEVISRNRPKTRTFKVSPNKKK